MRLTPVRDPDRNRLREVFADKATYELRTVLTADKLFVERGPVYPVTVTITYGLAAGFPVVTLIRGVVGGGYDDDGKDVNFGFAEITFAASCLTGILSAQLPSAGSRGTVVMRPIGHSHRIAVRDGFDSAAILL
ncbi:MAG: hypothetical protein QOD51_2452 [Candidatus Eremiobacteraeota bacterium]|nr:hypothetical protein [Candidatus Eremiobacteraeota bacterium]